MLTKLTPIETASEIIYQRHIIQKLRRDTLTGRTVKRPDPIHPAPPGRTTTKSERKYLP